ncbi:MAG TPA: hypothetical protein VHG91_07250 [Longimicrobium sp.]|nr:hypothetical protein [Longimicrobium sp.]
MIVLNLDQLAIETFDPVPGGVAYVSSAKLIGGDSGGGCTVDTTCAPTCNSTHPDATGG